MKKLLALMGVMFLLYGSCKKDGGKDCWEAQDPSGAPVYFNPPLCNITKKEAEERYPNYWFYRAGTATNCYRVQFGASTYYVTNMAEEIAQKHMQVQPAYQFTKIDCSSFCNLEWYEKHKSKVTGNYGPTLVFNETLLNADSCSKLFIGRVVIIRETSDSLITREVIEKKP
jgi:hypothetical protein